MKALALILMGVALLPFALWLAADLAVRWISRREVPALDPVDVAQAFAAEVAVAELAADIAAYERGEIRL